MNKKKEVKKPVEVQVKPDNESVKGLKIHREALLKNAYSPDSKEVKRIDELIEKYGK